MRRSFLALGCTLAAASSVVAATETITYRYDARGRLVKVERTGTASPTTTTYLLDKAGNRTSKTVTAP